MNSKLNEKEMNLLHTYFNKHNLYFLNSELSKLLEGRDLEVADKIFYDIHGLNDAILKTTYAYKGKVYINIPKAAYERYCANVGKVICNKTFFFGYSYIDRDNYFLEIKSESAISSDMLSYSLKDSVSYIFPKDTYFRVVEISNKCIKLEETFDYA